MIDIDAWKEVNALLRAAFPEEKIHSYNAGKGGQFRYIDARDVMDLFDDVVGPGNWSDDYEIWDAATCCVKGTVTIYGVSKSDVGYPNTPVGATNQHGQSIDSDEPFKDACTDAFKRACVKHGVGRFLYTEGNKGDAAAAGYRGAAPSDGQLKYVRSLAVEHGYQVDVTDLSKAECSSIIDGLKNDPGGFTHSRLTSITARPSRQEPTRQDADANGDVNHIQIKPATANQLATIAKLSRLLGEPEDPPADMSSAEAGDRITDLSREYNERKGTPTARRTV